jgi:ATP-dependent DNA ligase
VDVDELREVPVVLAAAVEAMPTAAAFRGWQAEPKYDGYRGLVLVGARSTRVLSRRGTDLTRVFPDVVAAAREQLPLGTVLDSELVIGVGGRLDFSALQRRVASPGRASQLAVAEPATLLAFDVLVLDDVDVRPQPLRQRREHLNELLASCRPPLQLVPATTRHDEALAWLEDYAAARVGVEGVVCKSLADPYLGGRRIWRKYRTKDTLELLVGAVTGSLARPERLVLAYFADEELVVAGGTTALTPAQARHIAELLREPQRPHPWPELLPSGGAGVWGREPIAITRVEPELVVEVLADTAVQGRHLRHLARFVRLRPELHPSDISPWSP